MAEPMSVVRPVPGIDVRSTLRFQSLLPGDPCTQLGAASLERATQTPDGPAAMRISWTHGDDATASVEAWGDGAGWIVQRADGLLGLTDDLADWAPDHRALRAVWERNTGLRICRTGTVWHDTAWFILQQRVRFIDAANAWRAMVQDLGAPAPGPLDLLVPPSHDTIARLPYERFHNYGIERGRADTLRRAAREMSRLERRVDDPFESVEPRLRSIRGIGPWTSAGLASLTWGAADAVIVGDVGLPGLVCWFLGREERGNDERMLELLEPYRPHRYRVIQMAFASGVRVPRRNANPYGIHDIRHR